MKNFTKTIFVIVAICLAVPSAFANDRIKQLVENGPGVTGTKYGSDGTLVSFMVVGTGRIRRSLPKHLALQQARRDAARQARNEVAKFFNTSVKWAENAGQELVCVTKGSAAGDDGAAQSNESSKFTEVSGEKSKACSEAALSGLRKVGSAYDSNGIYCEVWGWQYKSVKAIINASKAMGKAARVSINQAKAVEGARLQDPNAAYRKAERRDRARRAVSQAPAQTAAPVTNYGNNAPVVQKSSAAPDADDFF